MSVKLSRYVFRKIGGKIVPIRKGLEVATKSQSKLAEMILNDPDGKKNAKKVVSFFEKRNKNPKEWLFKIGEGVDSRAFMRMPAQDFVIKVPKGTKGTEASKALMKRYPEVKDKLAVAKAIADNAPNYGIPMTETNIIRLSKSKRGLLQKYITNKRDEPSGWIIREGEKVFKNEGLNLDIHNGNIIDGTVIDTGAALNKTRVTKLTDAGKEILGVEGYWNTKVKDLVGKSTVMSEKAVIEGQSPKALRKINQLLKSGYKFKQTGKNQYKLYPHKLPEKTASSIDQRINDRAKGIRFIRKNGKIIPIRTKE
jgi:hypothetical protein